MVFRRLNKRVVSSIDWQLIILLCILCGIGLTVLYSAGFDHDLGYSPPMKRQAISMAMGFVVFIICMLVSTNFWKRSSFLCYSAGCISLVMILLTGVVAGGARRWLDFGGFRMQPSEFMKLGLILALARYFSREGAPREGYTLKTIILPCILMFLPTIFILRQPDLGTGLCHLLIGGSMLLLAGVRWGTLLRLAIVCVMLLIPGWHLLQDYQKQRVLTFLSPEADPLGSGYHAIQSKIAVGSGSVSGKGFLKGTQSQLSFLPEQTTDFIFSVFAEEWGFFGTIMATTLYFLLVTRLLSISSRCSEAFPAYVSFGVASMVFWHFLINIGMVTGVLPVVGITLTLMSYGGSSVITMMAALGIVTGFSVRRYMFA